MPELLRRLSPGKRACEVTKAWTGETVVCIASGPSVTAQMLELVRDARARGEVRVIVANDMYLVAPWADVLYFADARWWKWHSDGIAKSWPWVSFTAEQVRLALADFAGQKVTIEHMSVAADPMVLTLANDSSRAGTPIGLSENPTAIRTGSNSGYQQLNIAVLGGANRILLVGYDMRFQGGKAHSHNGHPMKQNESVYLGFAKNFSSMEKPLAKLGVEVINCCPGSSIECFQKMTLEEAMKCRAPSA